jgi:hypothetical protein
LIVFFSPDFPSTTTSNAKHRGAFSGAGISSSKPFFDGRSASFAPAANRGGRATSL